MANVDDLNRLLNELRVIYRKHEMLKGLTTDFNIFKSIGSTSDEVNIHSKFIFAILKDRLYGKKFLFEFLKYVEIDLPSYEVIEKTTIYKEHKIFEGRLDLIINFETTNRDKFIIVIENKIYADDQKDQINTYIKHLEKEEKEACYSTTKMIYLTLDGREPSSEVSQGDPEKIICISYKNEIIQWIDDCIKIVALEPKIREVLVQYKAVLLELTGQEEGVLMEFKDIIGSSLENYVISKNIEASLKEVKQVLQLRFWKQLEIGLETQLKKIGIKNIQNTQKDGKLGNNNPWYSESHIRSFHTNSRMDKKEKNYGVLYNLGSIADIGNLYLKVTMGTNSVYFGLIKNIEPINEKSSNYERLIRSSLEKKYEHKKDSGYIVWKYLNVDGIGINMKAMDNKLAGKLMAKDEEFNSFMQNCVYQICELVEIVKSVDKSRN